MIKKGIFFFFILVFVVLINLFCPLNQSALAVDIPAFPGAEGFGAYTPGGRGGKVYKVTNLNDSGPGSLREAFKAEGSRIVVFAVSGTIFLESSLTIDNPYITIAGQSAPGDGITLRNYPLRITTHDVVVRYLRSRLGDAGPEGCRENDAITIRDAQNVILDHVSASWSVDETLSVTHGATDKITIQWSFITESLNNSCHEKGQHGYGSILGGHIEKGEARISAHHNLYAHHFSRNPKFAAEEDDDKVVCSQIDFRNNIIYNWGTRAAYTTKGQCTRVNYVANYLKPGPSTSAGAQNTAINVGGYSETLIFAQDNFLEGYDEANNNNWLMIRNLDEKRRRKEPFNYAQVTTKSSQNAYEEVLASGGATLPIRDTVDQRLVDEVKKAKGTIINSQTQVGGWPELKSDLPSEDQDNDGMPDEWEESFSLNPNQDDSAADADGNGYTNIEEYLNQTRPQKSYSKLLLQYGLISSNYDFNNDQIINTLDFVNLKYQTD